MIKEYIVLGYLIRQDSNCDTLNIFEDVSKMEKKYKKKEESQEKYLKEIEKINYNMALEAKRTLNSIDRTVEKIGTILYEQREKLEDIRDEAGSIRSNLEKGKELSVKMKRAEKLIPIVDKIGDKIKNIFKSNSTQKKVQLPPTQLQPATNALSLHKNTNTSGYKIEESPKEEDTNEVLLSIKNGLSSLKSKLQVQNKEINDQVPLIKEITSMNKTSTEDATKVMKNLKKI
ncbi:hypothetical protein NEOKW01_1961 [Nematocida sp. AWRm80]|nr:hypothetical protein NEOKW01_1961 [Nematocida sp. AWRm80]